MSKLYDLPIEQGATFKRSCVYRSSSGSPVDLTGYTVRAQIRETYASAAPLVALTCTLDDAAGGAFSFSLTAVETAALVATGGGSGQRPFYVWDLELELGGVVTRLLQGTVKVSPEVTR